MSDYHEPEAELAPEVRDVHRALNSLKEEIEAVDWYHQRVAVTTDAALREVLAHNRDEEIEHACMTLEWLRRNMPGWDEQLRARVFTEGPIVSEGHDHQQAGPPRRAADLGLGSLKTTRRDEGE
jgi:ferritin-like protein